PTRRSPDLTEKRTAPRYWGPAAGAANSTTCDPCGGTSSGYPEVGSSHGCSIAVSQPSIVRPSIVKDSQATVTATAPRFTMVSLSRSSSPDSTNCRVATTSGIAAPVGELHPAIASVATKSHFLTLPPFGCRAHPRYR